MIELSEKYCIRFNIPDNATLNGTEGKNAS